MMTRFFACISVAVLAVLGLAAVAAPSRAHETAEPSPLFDAKAALAYSQAAIGRNLGDYTFHNRRGAVVRLSDYRGRPLLVSLIYTGCTQSCPVIMQSLHDAAVVAQKALGRDSFSLVTIGFDSANDTPARMRAYAASRGLDLPNWAFLSGDEATIQRLSRTLGFTFYLSPKGFDHLAQISMIDSQGKVYRQVYGSNFKPLQLVEPLKDLVFGRAANFDSLSGIVNHVLLFCTLYDPASGRYRFDYSMFIGAAIGLIILVVLGTIVVRGWLGQRHRGAGA